MKRFLLISGALLLCTSVFADTKSVTFTVNPPLVCNNCETKVKDNLRFEKGVKSVKPSAKKGVVEVTYDDSKTDTEKLKEGFKKIGYEATELQPEVCPEESSECAPAAPCCGAQAAE